LIDKSEWSLSVLFCVDLVTLLTSRSNFTIEEKNLISNFRSCEIKRRVFFDQFFGQIGLIGRIIHSVSWEESHLFTSIFSYRLFLSKWMVTEKKNIFVTLWSCLSILNKITESKKESHQKNCHQTYWIILKDEQIKMWTLVKCSATQLNRLGKLWLSKKVRIKGSKSPISKSLFLAEFFRGKY
jgi:hypothetical protein